MEVDLYEAQQAASAAASTTVRDAEASVKVIELEETIAQLKDENEELERVLTIKTKEIDEYDDRHIESVVSTSLTFTNNVTGSSRNAKSWLQR